MQPNVKEIQNELKTMHMDAHYEFFIMKKRRWLALAHYLQI